MTIINEHNQLKRENFIKKLVSNAKAIISNQIALPLGARKMSTIQFWINQIEPLTEIDLQIFSDYESKTYNLPIGTERLTYHPDFLKQQDKILDLLTMQYKDQLLDKCFEIIATFTNKQ